MAERGHQRESVFIDTETGAVTHTVTPILPDAGFEDRIQGLKQSAADWDTTDPAAVRWIDLHCNGCGAVVRLDYDRPEYPPGWVEGDDGDFCPACAAN